MEEEEAMALRKVEAAQADICRANATQMNLRDMDMCAPQWCKMRVYAHGSID